MAEALTPVLKLTQPIVGASTNTWGNSLNDTILAIDALYRDRGGRDLESTETSPNVHNYEYTPAFTGGSVGEPDFVPLASTLFIRARVPLNKENAGAANLDYGARGNKPIRKSVDGAFVALVKGDLPENYIAEFIYSSTLVSGGAWILLNPAPKTVDITANDIAAANQLCAHRNLTLEALDDTHLRIKFDSVVLRKTDATSTKKYIVSPADLDITTAGAGGLHGLGLIANTWYTVYVIGKEDDDTINGISGILSPIKGGPGPTGGKWVGTVGGVNTVPPLPGGYSYYGFVGCARTDAARNLVDFHQVGNMVTILNLTATTIGKTNNNYSTVDLDFCPAEALAVRLGVSIASTPPTTAEAPTPKDVPIVAVGVRLAPQGSGVTAVIGEIGVNGVNVLQTQVTVGLRIASKVVARTTNTTPSTSLSVFELRVHGFNL